MQQKETITTFSQLLQGKQEGQLLEGWFDMLAQTTMNDFYLKAGDQSYRVTELEIYYHNNSDHSDPYVHRASEQLGSGNWYCHDSGIDITFGNPDEEIYGGILLRGIRTSGDQPRYISGPLNVRKEIFSAMGSVFTDKGGLYLEEAPVQDKKQPVKATRIGLKKSEKDTESYLERKYRYLTDFILEHKFKEKSKLVRQLLVEGLLSKKDAHTALNYHVSLK